MPEFEEVAPESLKPDTHGARFREGRKETGYSARAVGIAIGISAQAMHQFETRGEGLSLNNFVAACALLNLNVRWVLTGQGSRFEHGQPASAPKRGRTSKAGRPAARQE